MNLKNLSSRVARGIHKRGVLGLVILSYLFLTFYYMGPSFTRCTDTLYGFGDNTAGPIWTYEASGGSFIPGYTDRTNYPQGENLSSAVSIASAGQKAAFWPLAKVAGPVCGYNILNITAFMTTSLAMFGFIFWLVRSKWIAWLSGYAVAFVPYMQLKTGPHPSYGFSGILVGIFWLLLALIKNPTRKKALGLGALVAFCVYFDPYFVLYGGLVGVAVLLVWCLTIVQKYLKYKKPKTLFEDRDKEIFKKLLFSAIVAVIMLAPFVGISIASRDDIQKRVASVRGNVLLETKACANYPHEYLLPFVLHPLPSKLGLAETYKKLQIELKNNFSCGIAEDTVGVSLSLLSVIGFTGVVIAWDRLNKRKTSINGAKETKLDMFVVLSAVSLFVVGVAFGLPPTHVYGIPTPMQAVLDITTTWRTIARVFIIVNIAVVTLAASALYYHFRNSRISRSVKIFVFCTILLAVFVEYQIFAPFRGNEMSTFSYSQDIPDVYRWLKDQKDINAIAEYPLESYGVSDAPSYYLSMQSIHGKHLLNSPSPESSLEMLRYSIKDLNSPQTLPALRALGIDIIIVHGPDDEFIKTHELFVPEVFTQPEFNLTPHAGVVNNDKSVVLATGHKPGLDNKAFVGLLSSGFYRNLGIIKYPNIWSYEAVDGAEIVLKTAYNGSIEDNQVAQDFCFNIRTSAPDEVVEFQPIVDGTKGFSQPIDGLYRQFRIKAKDSIVLKNNNSSNMQVANLGCEQ